VNVRQFNPSFEATFSDAINRCRRPPCRNHLTVKKTEIPDSTLAEPPNLAELVVYPPIKNAGCDRRHQNPLIWGHQNIRDL
jgi:hypothetical protein